MTMKQHCQVNFPATANDRKCFNWNQKSQLVARSKTTGRFKSTSEKNVLLPDSMTERFNLVNCWSARAAR